MSHQCVHCGKIINSGSKEILEGCGSCGGRFFLYISEEQLKKKKESLLNLSEKETKKVEKEIREISGIKNEEQPIILDLESVRSIGEGKFEIDLVNLMDEKRPLIYKIEEGKYMVDISPKKTKRDK